MIEDNVGELRARPPKHVHGPSDLATTGTRTASTVLYGDFAWRVPPTTTTTGTGGGAVSSTDQIRFVSKTGSDNNDGLSWSTAKVTVGAGLGALGINGGTVYVGAGVYQEQITLIGNRTVIGTGRYSTVLELATNGNLVTVSNENNARMEHIGLRFANSGVTGNLMYHSNAFTCDFIDVRFSGTKTTGQVGLLYTANAGDCHFYSCYWDTLEKGVRADSTLHLFTDCMFTNNTKGVESGSTTGAPGGASFQGCVFRGAGTHYVHLTGRTQAFHFNECWYDGNGADTAIEVGSGTNGPWLFSLTNCPSLLGKIDSLIINCATQVHLEAVVFGNDGANPNDITVNATNAPRGSVASCYSLQGRKIETLVPPKWKGWLGYVQSSDSTVQLVETADDLNFATFGQTHRRIVVRIANRATGTAAATLTFPSAFETTFGGGQFFKVFDNTGIGAGLTFTASSITIPTGVAVSTGMIILEGF